jgi:hypothetical protein
MEGRMVYFVAGIFVLFSVASLIAGIGVGSDTYSRPPDVVAINAMRSDNLMLWSVFLFFMALVTAGLGDIIRHLRRAFPIAGKEPKPEPGSAPKAGPTYARVPARANSEMTTQVEAMRLMDRYGKKVGYAAWQQKVAAEHRGELLADDAAVERAAFMVTPPPNR